jgi:hypothetical protein
MESACLTVADGPRPTKARLGIWVNDTLLRRGSMTEDGPEALQFGKLYTGDIIMSSQLSPAAILASIPGVQNVTSRAYAGILVSMDTAN